MNDCISSLSVVKYTFDVSRSESEVPILRIDVSSYHMVVTIYRCLELSLYWFFFLELFFVLVYFFFYVTYLMIRSPFQELIDAKDVIFVPVIADKIGKEWGLGMVINVS